ncbi:MAG: gliding motility-associated C-terminal domain-containing protein [Bacteroidetes bacterium]|nr:gliding motility-associated C-terminal domain-containing protein [Bacteroidota bacterium]
MEKRTLNLFLAMLPLCLPFFSRAQQANPYIINGFASQTSCNCYTLTPDEVFVAGSVWNKNKIDLTQSFDYNFTVFLGCHDSQGADGIAFVLQPIGTSIGATGQGIGFQGVSPSVGIPIDTWQNLDYNDPVYDHIGIYKNGDVNNYDLSNVLAGPVAVLPGNGNIEDCKWHTFRISWEAATHRLSAFVDGAELVHTTVDIVKDIFGGDPNVYWGFTAATGGGTNLQRFCTSLNASFNIPADEKTCFPNPITLNDISTSFGSIVKWYWTWGDGKIDSVQHPPAHVYPAPGLYNAKLNIVGNNGCLSDTFTRQITIGSKPVANFGYTSTLTCANVPIQLFDSSYVQYGTLNNWSWNINNGQQTISNPGGGLAQNFPAGLQNIALTVSTAEGCVSDPVSHSLLVFPYPSTNMTVQSACYGDPVVLKSSNTDPSVDIRQWYWQLGDGTIGSGSNIVHVYAKEGQYPVSVIAVSNEGCYSDSVNAFANVYKTNAFAGNDTLVAIGQPIQLQGSGGELYKWEPSTGLNDNTIADPIAILQQDQTYVLTAYTEVGCATSDTIHIKAYKGPALYVPSAFTPNGDGRNDKFRCIAVGMRTFYFFNIYNRYGQLLFSSRDSWQGWDGTYNGQQQPMGTYVWMAKAIDYKGDIHLEKGTVVLIR